MAEETVREARDRYFRENGLSASSYTNPKFPVYVGRWAVWLPNPGFLPYHDLHHVATGFRTGLVGEAEISAYELRAGCRSLLIRVLCFGAIAGALFVAPRRVVNAWRQSRGMRTLYFSTVDYEALLDMTVRELRQHLGMPPSGLANAAPVTERDPP